jgi:hypothetical protein
MRLVRSLQSPALTQGMRVCHTAQGCIDVTPSALNRLLSAQVVVMNQHMLGNLNTRHPLSPSSGGRKSVIRYLRAVREGLSQALP